MIMATHQRFLLGALTAGGLLLVATAGPSGAGRRVFDDDPRQREPDTQDASKVQPWDIGLLYDLGYQLVVTSRRTPSNTRAQNINTIDEVPDSSWFTNRIGSRPVSVDEVLAGTTQGLTTELSQFCGPTPHDMASIPTPIQRRSPP